VNGYGFPSSHSQYMGFFAAFLLCHLYFRHRFSSTGYPILDSAWRLFLYFAITFWAVVVAYSRYYLECHNPPQVIWGFIIGVALGLTLYIAAELVPTHRPNSSLGKFRRWLVDNPVSVWLQLRDGWAVWGDGGREEEWTRWRQKWESHRWRGGGKNRRTMD